MELNDPDDGDRPRKAPEWLKDASMDVFRAAAAGQFVPDVQQARRDLFRAVQRFAEAGEAHGGDDGDWLQLADFLAGVVVKLGGEDFTRGIEVVDNLTGEVVDCPDAEVDDPLDRAALTAIRMVMARATGDDGMLTMSFEMALGVDDKPDDAGAGDAEAGEGETKGAEMLCLVILVLAEMAGAAFVDQQQATGQLTDTATLMLMERRTRDAAARPPDPVRVSRGRSEYVVVPTAGDEDAFQPHGEAAYMFAAHPVWDGFDREETVRAAHADLVTGARDWSPGIRLCGVLHAEEFEVGRAPEVLRRAVERRLREARRHTGLEWRLMLCWQHRGECPNG